MDKKLLIILFVIHLSLILIICKILFVVLLTEKIHENTNMIEIENLPADNGIAAEVLKENCVEYIEISGNITAIKIPFEECSENKPIFCKDGSLISKCNICGCEIYEECYENGECVLIKNTETASGSGSGNSEADETGEGTTGGAGAKTEEDNEIEDNCIDHDILTNPNPIYHGSYCTDNSGTYIDICSDPITHDSSDVWIKEYRCKSTIDGLRCIGEFKSCPTNSEMYYGSSDSQCNLNLCTIPPNCEDGILNQDESGIDCGGSCPPCPETCYDSIKNNDEEDVDCGGSCPLCQEPETCFDGILNQDEEDVDCGGSCTPCQEPETCFDGILNQDEEEIDCGGSCSSCENGGGGEESTPACNVEPVDSAGLTVFTDSICTDNYGAYSNSCESPLSGEASRTFIKTHTCINNKCTATYYSCQILGKEKFGEYSYECNEGKCII